MCQATQSMIRLCCNWRQNHRLVMAMCCLSWAASLFNDNIVEQELLLPSAMEAFTYRIHLPSWLFHLLSSTTMNVKSDIIQLHGFAEDEEIDFSMIWCYYFRFKNNKQDDSAIRHHIHWRQKNRTFVSKWQWHFQTTFVKDWIYDGKCWKITMPIRICDTE